jgi:hypothetical protein
MNKTISFWVSNWTDGAHFTMKILVEADLTSEGTMADAGL